MICFIMAPCSESTRQLLTFGGLGLGSVKTSGVFQPTNTFHIVDNLCYGFSLNVSPESTIFIVSLVFLHSIRVLIR